MCPGVLDRTVDREYREKAVAGTLPTIAPRRFNPAREAWLPMERLANEFEAVGFYLSGHPLDDYMPRLTRLGVDTWSSFHDKALTKGATVAKLAGTITHRQERRSKSGNKFAFVGFSDPTGQFETICFSDTLAVSRDLLEPGKAVIARVEADVDGEEVRLRLQGVEELDKAAAQILRAVHAAISIGGKGKLTPIMLSRVTRSASLSSLHPSVPAGRIGITR